MRVYLAEYNNGEAWGDFSEWHGKKVYINKQDCINEILGNGYKFNVDTNEFELIDEEMYDHFFAITEVLELI